jgi:hypothetical protein
MGERGKGSGVRDQVIGFLNLIAKALSRRAAKGIGARKTETYLYDTCQEAGKVLESGQV